MKYLKRTWYVFLLPILTVYEIVYYGTSFQLSYRILKALLFASRDTMRDVLHGHFDQHPWSPFKDRE